MVWVVSVLAPPYIGTILLTLIDSLTLLIWVYDDVAALPSSITASKILKLVSIELTSVWDAVTDAVYCVWPDTL